VRRDGRVRYTTVRAIHHLASELLRISGVDLTRMDGIDIGVAQTLISENRLRDEWLADGRRFSLRGRASVRILRHGDEVRNIRRDNGPQVNDDTSVDRR
jgi:hypothetical protein